MADAYIPYNGPIVTREEAVASGLKKFFTGIPCEKAAHLSERNLRSRCLACQKAYDAERYIQNDEAVRAKVKQWQLDNPAAHKESKARHYKENTEHYSARAKAYYEANKDHRRAAHKRYYEENREKFREYSQAWNAAHPEAALANARTRKLNRRAREAAVGGSVTHEEIQALVKRQKFKCASCSASIKTKRHIDHIMPLALGGSGSIDNLQALCPPCNWSKGAKCPITWAQSRGRLL